MMSTVDPDLTSFRNSQIEIFNVCYTDLQCLQCSNSSCFYCMIYIHMFSPGVSLHLLGSSSIPCSSRVGIMAP